MPLKNASVSTQIDQGSPKMVKSNNSLLKALWLAPPLTMKKIPERKVFSTLIQTMSVNSIYHRLMEILICTELVNLKMGNTIGVVISSLCMKVAMTHDI